MLYGLEDWLKTEINIHKYGLSVLNYGTLQARCYEGWQEEGNRSYEILRKLDGYNGFV